MCGPFVTQPADGRRCVTFGPSSIFTVERPPGLAPPIAASTHSDSLIAKTRSPSPAEAGRGDLRTGPHYPYATPSSGCAHDSSPRCMVAATSGIPAR
jgi:hypothetical protein